MNDAEYQDLLNRMPKFATNAAPDAAPVLSTNTGSGHATRGQFTPCNVMAGHCWHSTGRMTLDKPQRYPQYCCHCDARREVDSSADRSDGHGPYARHREFKSHFDVPEQK